MAATSRNNDGNFSSTWDGALLAARRLRGRFPFLAGSCGPQPVTESKARFSVQMLLFVCTAPDVRKDFDPSNPYAGMNQMGKNLNKCCSLAVRTGDVSFEDCAIAGHRSDHGNSSSESTGLVRSRARHLQANLWDELKGVPRQLPVARNKGWNGSSFPSGKQPLRSFHRRLLIGRGRECWEPRKCQQKRLGQLSHDLT